MYFRICECCGAALDPGERCDCLDVVSLDIKDVQESQLNQSEEKLWMNL